MQRARSFKTTLWTCGLLSVLASAALAGQPTSGDEPIVPNPNAPASDAPSPSSSAPDAPTPDASGAAPTITPTANPNSLKPSTTPTSTPTPAAAEGGLYISDTGNNRLVYISGIDGKERKTLGRAGKGPGYFLHPCQIWVDPLGKIFVADRDNNRIIRMDEITGKGWTEMGSLSHPEGIASRGDEIYVANTGADEVVVFKKDMNGAPLRAYRDPRIKHPTSLWLDDKKDLYVTCGQDPPGGRVVKLVDPLDTKGAKWEIYEGANLRQLGFAPSQLVTWRKQIWMADPGASRVVRVDNLQGRSPREVGAYGEAVGKFRSPTGLALNKQGTLYVADTGNDRIVEMDGATPKDWHVYNGALEGVALRAPVSVFCWSPCPAPPPPEDEKGKDKDKKPKK